MQRFVTLSAVALAAAMVAPVGSATWAFYGATEPQGTYNQNGGYMWGSAPGSATDRVYFHAVELMGVNSGAITPNSAALESRMSTVGDASWNAILGVWADCNHDGFIGLADSGVLEYPASAAAAAGSAVDPGVCPPQPDGATGVTHNNNGWITELIAIGPAKSLIGRDNAQDAVNATNYRLLFDDGVRVWGERSEPVTPAAEVSTDACGQANVVPPFSKGETSHTGGVLTQVNCDESIFAPTASTLYQVAVGEAPALGALPDPSTLWANGGALDKPTFGDEHQTGGGAIVSGEEDCSSEATDTGAPNPIGGTGGQDVTVHSPGAPSVNPQGSAAGTVNETYQETLDNCSGTDADWGVAGTSGAVFAASGLVYGNGVTETNTADNQQIANKVAAYLNFAWNGPQARGACETQTAWQSLHRQFPGPNPVDGGPFPDDPLGASDPSAVPAAQCGQPTSALIQQTAVTGNDMWNSQVQYLNTAPTTGARNPNNLDRSTSPPSYKPDTFTADWWTFYATVTLSGVATPGNAGTYGSEFCVEGIGPGATSHFGWDCDPADWNLDPTTSQKVPTVSHLATVGDAYNLRDVVCLDTTLIGAGSSLNPTGQDVGGRSVGAINDPAHGCH
ncbi:MAG: hypothetical protein QOE90_944 [Thermoplasmata archaeon]|nr:hypothetical protein [Thermoplasmata archaeon]